MASETVVSWRWALVCARFQSSSGTRMVRIGVSSLIRVCLSELVHRVWLGRLRVRSCLWRCVQRVGWLGRLCCLLVR